MAGPPSSTSSRPTLTNVTPAPPPYSSVFLSTRSIAFGLICFISFLCIIILCIQIFLDWDMTSKSERSLVVVMLLVQTLTILGLAVLILLEFRPWLEAARLLCLLMLHIGTSSLFTRWFQQFQANCPKSEEQCILFNAYILSGSWIVSVLLILYAGGLAFMMYRRAKMLASTGDEESVTVVENGRSSFLPIMAPPQPSPLPIAARYAYERRVSARSHLSLTTTSTSEKRMTAGSRYNTAPPRVRGFPATPIREKRITIPAPLPSPTYSRHMSMGPAPSVSLYDHRLTMGSVRYGVAV